MSIRLIKLFRVDFSYIDNTWPIRKTSLYGVSKNWLNTKSATQINLESSKQMIVDVMIVHRIGIEKLE